MVSVCAGVEVEGIAVVLGLRESLSMMRYIN